MKLVSPKQISQTEAYLNSLEDAPSLEVLIDQLGDRQPLLFAFLMTMGEQDFNEDERELLLYLGLAIWHTLEAELGRIARVDALTIQKVQEHCEGVFRAWTAKVDEFDQELESLISRHAQPHILRFVVRMVFGEEADFVRPGNRIDMVMFLHIFLDCLLTA